MTNADQKVKELQIKVVELQLQKLESTLTDFESKRPVSIDKRIYIPILVALITIVGTIFGYVWNHRTAIILANDEYRSKLILKAFEAADRKKAAELLNFYLENKLIDDKSGKLKGYIDNQGKKIPLLSEAYIEKQRHIILLDNVERYYKLDSPDPNNKLSNADDIYEALKGRVECTFVRRIINKDESIDRIIDLVTDLGPDLILIHLNAFYHSYEDNEIAKNETLAKQFKKLIGTVNIESHETNFVIYSRYPDKDIKEKLLKHTKIKVDEDERIFVYSVPGDNFSEDNVIKGLEDKIFEALKK